MSDIWYGFIRTAAFCWALGVCLMVVGMAIDEPTLYLFAAALFFLAGFDS